MSFKRCENLAQTSGTTSRCDYQHWPCLMGRLRIFHKWDKADHFRGMKRCSREERAQGSGRLVLAKCRVKGY